MTLLIKNVKILGEKDIFPERSDVFISGNKISAIGDFPKKQADEVLDGKGEYLVPGFIDIDTTSDHYLSLIRSPLQEDFLRQGVTTIVGGHCGSSLAPLIYGTLESIRKWADPSSINVNWHSVEEFFDVLERIKPGVNFGMFAGHSTIRRALLGDEIRALSENETKVFSRVLRDSMRQGAYGLSTGLEYVHSQKTTLEELIALCKVVVEEEGLYATHLRKTGVG